MDDPKTKAPRPDLCAECGKLAPSYDIVNYGSIETGYKTLCSLCFNGMVAKLAGLEKFENIALDPVGIADCDGTVHQFHFRTNLFGPGVALDAFEVRGGKRRGYEFQIIGEPEDDLFVLLSRLIERIRRALSVKHIVEVEYGPQVADRVVRGRIESDLDCDPRVPLIVVDGREMDWDQFGRMLMTFEGFHFRLQIHDATEEL